MHYMAYKIIIIMHLITYMQRNIKQPRQCLFMHALETSIDVLPS